MIGPTELIVRVEVTPAGSLSGMLLGTLLEATTNWHAGVLVGVFVMVGVLEGVSVFVLVGVLVIVRVLVIVGVFVMVGLVVMVGVVVIVGVFVMVGVLLAVGVLVLVGGVPVGVAVFVGHTIARPHPFRVPVKPGSTSLTVSTHVPLGFSPLNAERGLAGRNVPFGVGGQTDPISWAELSSRLMLLMLA